MRLCKCLRFNHESGESYRPDKGLTRPPFFIRFLNFFTTFAFHEKLIWYFSFQGTECLLFVNSHMQHKTTMLWLEKFVLVEWPASTRHHFSRPHTCQDHIIYIFHYFLVRCYSRDEPRNEREKYCFEKGHFSPSLFELNYSFVCTHDGSKKFTIDRNQSSTEGRRPH